MLCLYRKLYKVNIIFSELIIKLILIRECRIDGDVSDANTKVYGDGSAIFKILFLLIN